ncbi:MAG: serine hydrolase [Saprospiraceae bacterium]|nr:serine hydrolase [Saprospiraceae bacterium]
MKLYSICFQFSLVFSIAVIPGNTIGQTSNLDKVDQYLQNYHSSIPVPGFSIVIVEGDKVIFNKGYGKELLGKSQPMSPRSILNIGAVGRGFTALAVMQLVEKGVLDLDTPITEYLPWFRTANKEYSDMITLRMCLSNTSGIPPQYESLPELEATNSSENFVRTFRSFFIKRKPGLSHEFCDEGYSIAGLVISKVTDISYAEYIHQNVLLPLEMKRSAVGSEMASSFEIIEGHEMGLSQCYPASKPRTDPNFIAAGSEIYSSTSDLGKYMTVLLNNGKYQNRQLLSATSIKELFKSNTSFQGLGTMLGGNGIDIGYALGWMEMEIENRNILIHIGNNGNVGSIIGVNRDKNQAFAMLFNADVNRLDRVEYPGMENTVNNVIHILNGEKTTDFGVVRDNQVFEEDYRLPEVKRHKYIGQYQPFGEESPLFKDMNLEVILNKEGIMELISRQEEAFKGHYELEFTNESRAILRSIAQPREIQFSIYPDGFVGGLFMFGTEFKKVDTTYLSRFKEIQFLNEDLSFLWPENVEYEWVGNQFKTTLEDFSNAVIEISISKLKSQNFEQYIQIELEGKALNHQGVLNKSSLKEGLWTEQTVITEEQGKLHQYIFAFYQDPISGKQMQLTLSNTWGDFSSELLDVLQNIQKSVAFGK